MRATVTAALISAGVLCAQEPEVPQAIPVAPAVPAPSPQPVAPQSGEICVTPSDFFYFFMMSWNFVRNEAELDVKLPSAREVQESKPPAGAVILNVKRDGSVVMNRREMNARELQEALSKIAKLSPDQAVVLSGDRDVNYKHIVDVLEVCRAANIWNVAFAASKPE